MKKAVIALFVLNLLSLGISIYILLSHSQDKKIVYADAIQLFNGYKYKTDLEKAGQGTLSKLKASLDSVGIIYKVNPGNPNTQLLVAEKQQQLSQAYEAMNKEINQKVWERLNPLIQAFGKEHHIEMLIGANGMGTLLYASEEKDMTQDLIQYVNRAYEGNY